MGPLHVTVGISGTRNMKEVPEAFIEWLKTIHWDRESTYTFLNGGCIGSDVIIGEFLSKRFSRGNHVTILPINRTLVDPSHRNWSTAVMEMLGGSYKERNQMIVDLSHSLIAFPDYPEEHGRSTRSGTWQTVRMARKAGVPYKEFLLNPT